MTDLEKPSRQALLTIFSLFSTSKFEMPSKINPDFCLRDRRGYLLFEEFMEATSQSVSKKVLKLMYLWEALKKRQKSLQMST